MNIYILLHQSLYFPAKRRPQQEAIPGKGLRPYEAPRILEEYSWCSGFLSPPVDPLHRVAMDHSWGARSAPPRVSSLLGVRRQPVREEDRREKPLPSPYRDRVLSGMYIALKAGCSHAAILRKAQERSV
jgi:hypothetical protein